MNLQLGWKSKKALGRNAGVTLLEVLVSLLVLSFGLLGVAGLQAVTASYKVNSWARNSAALLLSDFAERVRANPEAAKPVAGVGLYEVKTPWSSTAEVPSLVSDENCLDKLCGPKQRAAYDLWAWRKRVRGEMPQGSAWVEGDRDQGFKVTLMWMDKGFTGAGDDKATLQSSTTCSAADPSDPSSSVQQASCCPSDAKVAIGVRCQNFFFKP
jgi:type IV pilus assembly protein PilV